MAEFIEKLRSFQDKVALIENGTLYTYSDLIESIERIEKEYIYEIESGKVVAILSDYSLNSIASLLALHRNKNIIVPIISNLSEEIDNRIQEAFVDVKITIEGNFFNLETFDSDDVKHDLIVYLNNSRNSGLVLFSSGSTGKPKAMIHNLDELISVYLDRRPKKIAAMLFLLFDHIGGLNTLFNFLSMGATLVIPPSRNPETICQLIEKYGVRLLPASPSFLNLIMISGSLDQYDLSSLRMITYGTESMPDSLLERVKKTFPRVKLMQTFGTSETGIATVASKSSSSTFMKIDDPNFEYKIVDDELWLRSSTQILGYLNTKTADFTEDGWFKTGDLVESIEDGYIKIKGRNKEIINVGGEKVLPNEVESVLLEIDFIDDCIVYGEPTPITGQTVVADMIVNKELSARDAKKEARKFCKNKLDPYKIPTKVRLVESLNIGDRFKKNRRR